MLNFLKREQPKDPFGGGDDDFEGESRFAGKGPKIALAASGVLFLILAGGIAAIVMTGKVVPPPVTGSFADLEVVDEPAPAPAAAPTPETKPGAPPAKVADTTAATDRSVERRPWLAVPATSAEKRPGVTGPAPKAPDAKAPETKTAAKAPEVKVPEAKALETKAPEAKAPEAKTALMTPPPAAAPPAKAPETKAAENKAAPAAPPAKTAEAPKEPAKEAPKEAAVADVSPFGPAPGAPGLFNAPAGADAGPAVAGGRPRLVDPSQPPIDKTAISAPPPRFANIAAARKGAPPATAGPAPTTAKVAVVIDGLGLSQTATDAAITKLPSAVTLAFSPYTRNLKKWTEKAKAGGHEVLIQLPMESKEFPAEDPGPLGLLTSIKAKENALRLDAILKDAGDAVGVLDSEGSKFRESEPHISAVFTKLKEKNLFYVQGEPGVRIGEASVPVAVADVVLDERPFRAAVDARLDYAERLAKYQGSAVAAVGAKPVSFERLVLWLEQAQKKGVVLAPISEVLIRSEAANAPAPAAAPAAKTKAGEAAPAKGKGPEQHEAAPAKAEPKGKTAH